MTTGEVLFREFSAGGKESGEALVLAAGDRPELRLEIEWTFPLRFAEVISGDGSLDERARDDPIDRGRGDRRVEDAIERVERRALRSRAHAPVERPRRSQRLVRRRGGKL